MSEFQPGIDWAQVAASGIQFAYAKATEGVTVTDSQFANNWAGMKANGVLRGAYHFFHPADSGTTQADDFLAVVGTLGQPGDLPPMLDFEYTDPGTTNAQAVTEAQNFINEIQARTGLTTVIYTYPYYWENLTGADGGDITSQFSAYPFWIASYATTAATTGNVPQAGYCPDVFAPWSAWTLWQWSSTGSNVPSISGDCDMDVYNGTLAQLTAWASGMTTPVVAPIAQVSGNEALTLVNWPDKHMELFARTPSGTELHTATAGTNDVWSAPAALGSGAECGSAASFWGASWSYPNLFSPLASGSTGDISWTAATGWDTYQPFGGSGLSELSSTVTSDGRAEVFALGADHTIWQNAFDATTSAWAGWASLGGTVTFATGVGAITWGNGTVEVFGIDTAGNPWHMWSDSTGSAGWSAWTAFPAGGTLASRPVPVRWADGLDGHAEVFARGTDGQLYHSDFSYTNDWPGFTVVSAGSQIIGEPSAIMNPGGAGATQGPEIFARDPTGQVVHVAWNGSAYGTFSALGTEIAASDPFGWTRGDGAGEVFAIDTAGRLVHSYNNPTSGWTAWSTIGNGFDSCAPGSPVMSADGGVLPDAGLAENDGGIEAGDGGTAVSAGDDGGTGRPATQAGGCDCSAGQATPVGLIWLLLVAGMARSSQRRRRSDQSDAG